MRLLLLLHIERWVHIIYILLVQFFTKQLYGFSKALEMDDLALTEELDNIIYVRIIGKPQDIVIGYTCFLLCCNCVRITRSKNPVFMRVFGIGIFG